MITKNKDLPYSFLNSISTFNFKTKGFNKLTFKGERKLRDYIQYCSENHRYIYKEHILEILKTKGRKI